jgi:hypothetical protein
VKTKTWTPPALQLCGAGGFAFPALENQRVVGLRVGDAQRNPPFQNVFQQIPADFRPPCLRQSGRFPLAIVLYVPANQMPQVGRRADERLRNIHLGTTIRHRQSQEVAKHLLIVRFVVVARFRNPPALRVRQSDRRRMHFSSAGTAFRYTVRFMSRVEHRSASVVGFRRESDQSALRHFATSLWHFDHGLICVLPFRTLGLTSRSAIIPT